MPLIPIAGDDRYSAVHMLAQIGRNETPLVEMCTHDVTDASLALQLVKRNLGPFAGNNGEGRRQPLPAIHVPAETRAPPGKPQDRGSTNMKG